VHRVLADDADRLAALASVRARTDAEVFPGDPPPPPAELRGDLFEPGPHEQRVAWVATVEGEPAGELVASVEEPPNEHLVQVEWLGVVAEHRRRGVAAALVRALLVAPELVGRTDVTFWIPGLAGGAGPAVAERWGVTLRLTERCSRLAVADVPWDVVDGWRTGDGDRDDGYRLVQWTGPVPDEHVPALVAVRRAMEDQPVDDLDRTIPTLDEEAIRAWDRAALGRGLVPVFTVAVAADGAPAGYSALFVNGHRPEIGLQGDTGVLAAHRGHGLGRWLKAENLALALATEPRISSVLTYNAESNPWMLDINVAMGFRPHVRFEAWQAAVDDVRAAVGA